MSTVDTEDVGNVRIVTLNRPESMNALDAPTLGALGTAMLQADADPAVRAIVLTAAGERAFCVGMDLKAFASDPDSFKELHPDFLAFQTDGVRTPLIGAAQGTAVGGGLEVLLACDIILLADHVKVGLPEVKRGLFAGGGGTRLSTRIPIGLAMEIALTGDYITAARAEEIGLANRAVPVAELRETALTLASTIAANAPLALATTKMLLIEAMSQSPAEAWKRIKDVSPSIFESKDAHEGAVAFGERREPVWTGQ